MRIAHGVTALVIACALAALIPAAALASPPKYGGGEPPTLEPWAGEESTASCDAGNWNSDAGPIEFTYEWVLDPGAGETVVHTDGPTGAGQASYTAQPANVNHVLACRVKATNGDGTTGAAPTR